MDQTVQQDGPRYVQQSWAWGYVSSLPHELTTLPSTTVLTKMDDAGNPKTSYVIKHGVDKEGRYIGWSDDLPQLCVWSTTIEGLRVAIGEVSDVIGLG